MEAESHDILGATVRPSQRVRMVRRWPSWTVACDLPAMTSQPLSGRATGYRAQIGQSQGSIVLG